MNNGAGKGKAPGELGDRKSPEKGMSVVSKEGVFRADKIDLKNLDLQLEKQLSKVWSESAAETSRPKEEWEIELAALEFRYVFARGTYGTIYRGTYGDRDVAAESDDDRGE